MAATRKSQAGDNNPSFKHGFSRIASPTYQTWIQMRRRCRERPRYKPLGVCSRWGAFENFLQDMGERPDGHILDRIDNEDGYHPENCRWVTPRTNANNRKNTVMITYNGETRSASDWADLLGIERQTICWRVRHGWTPGEALGFE